MASYRNPGQIFSYLSMHGALLVDHLTAKRPSYAAKDWPSAQAELNHLYPKAAGFLLEPELDQVQALIRDNSQGRSGAQSQSRSFNSDPTLARCLYVLCRALTPTVVVETGVANGMSSAFILQALRVNRHGTLHSIDLPLPGKNPGMIGVLIPNELRSRWHLHLGSSRRALPHIVRGHIVDIFVHDSLHTYRNMRREFDVAWPRIRPGGVLVSDDVDGNPAFDELRLRGPRYWQVIRQERKPDALFGIAVKD